MHLLMVRHNYATLELIQGGAMMPMIMPIRDMRDTSRIDQAIYESEKEMAEGGESVALDDAFERLNSKYYG